MDSIIWTPAVTADMVALWHNKKYNCQKIALYLSETYDLLITANAVVGKARRMGLPYRRTGQWRDDPLRDPNAPVPGVQEPEELQQEEQEPEQEPTVREPEPPTAVIGHYSITDLQDKSCRWPTDFMQYCGAPQSDDCPYCPTHREIAFKPSFR